MFHFKNATIITCIVHDIRREAAISGEGGGDREKVVPWKVLLATSCRGQITNYKDPGFSIEVFFINVFHPGLSSGAAPYPPPPFTYATD